MISPQRNRISADGNEFFFWAFLTDKDTPNGTDFCPRSTLLFLYKVAYKKILGNASSMMMMLPVDVVEWSFVIVKIPQICS